MSLCGVKPSDTRRATVVYPDGHKHQFDAIAELCFSGWDGYWSLDRLSKYVGSVFPGSVSCFYV